MITTYILAGGNDRNAEGYGNRLSDEIEGQSVVRQLSREGF